MLNFLWSNGNVDRVFLVIQVKCYKKETLGKNDPNTNTQSSNNEYNFHRRNTNLNTPLLATLFYSIFFLHFIFSMML